MSGSEFIPYYPGNVTNTNINTLPSVKDNIGDFTPFYLAIAICTLMFTSIMILNLLCCYSRHSHYWLDRHTGNRWLATLWSATPYRQPPLDLAELESNSREVYLLQFRNIKSKQPKQNIPQNISQQPLTSAQENLDVDRLESYI